MAKVPHGKVIYIGALKYVAGQEIPDDILAKVKPAAGARAPAKPAGAPPAKRLEKPRSSGDDSTTIKP